MGERKIKLFSIQNYYDYIKQLEKSVKIAYIAIMIVFIIIALSLIPFTMGISLILIPIGFGLAKARTISTKIKIEEMKWQIDLHTEICRNKEVV